jgi:hypothetical protein
MNIEISGYSPQYEKLCRKVSQYLTGIFRAETSQPEMGKVSSNYFLRLFLK